jgi:hypothetical protein
MCRRTICFPATNQENTPTKACTARVATMGFLDRFSASGTMYGSGWKPIEGYKG